MKRRHSTYSLLAAVVLLFSSQLLAAVQLSPVATSLSSPVFVTGAGDGSNRLFIVEQSGTIRVLQPGSTAPTVFLNLSSKIAFGGEQGLLGLAFHPQYQVNGRFFVFYTRAGDGALVVSQFFVSANRNVADPTEVRFLVIPHPTNTNHNGGMLAFGPDGYLYIGTGDGGSEGDPANNAQNPNVLLGKILRINVDQRNRPAGLFYTVPPGNPFLNAPGADEIFALGFRNPWRFSFDRFTGQQWVGDVGQDAFEEVDTPIVAGGNYGWRVFEGFNCSGRGPAPCNSANYVSPIFQYGHTNGRCAITGGYVYRGSQGTFQSGTYVFGDYCSGEIFTWNGTTQTLLLSTGMNISSFGEDDQGELYVVGLGGSVSRLTSSTPCSYGINPASQTVAATGGSGTVGVTAASGCGWTARANASWLRVTSGATGSGNGSVGFAADANTSSSSRSGTLTIATKTFRVNQGGAAGACRFSITPTTAKPGGAGGNATIAVTAGAGCAWTARSNDTAWIRIVSGASGSGNGTVTYSVSPYNNPPHGRQGTLTVAGITFSINQSSN